MADLSFTQYDTAPSIYGTLTIDDVPMPDIETATQIRFQMRLTTSNAYVVDAVAAIEDEAEGTVRYDWAEGNLDIPGGYVSHWEVTYPDGSTQHSHPKNTLTVTSA